MPPGRLPAMFSARRPFALLLAVPALLAGCSATPATTSPASTPPAISTQPTPVSTTPTDAPGSPNSPAAACPSGEYKATGFTATGADSRAGTGTVTGVDATFRNGRYDLDFDDDNPVGLTINGKTQQVRVDGEIRGGYSGAPDDLTFTLDATTGHARFTVNGKRQTLTMKQVAAILAPQGKGSAVCNGDNLTLKTGSLTWELVRDID